MGQPQSADASPAFSSSPEALPTVSSSPRPVPDSSTHAPTAVPSPDSPSSRHSRDLKFSPLTTDPMDMEIDTLVESPPPSPTETASPAPRRSLAARIFGGARPSLAPTTVDENSTAAFEPLDTTPADPVVPQPIAQVPMQRCSVTTHLRPSFVTAMSLPRLGSKLGRRRSTAAMLIPKESPPAEEPPAPAPAPAVVDVTDPFVKMDSLSSPSNNSAVSSSLGSDSDDEESVDDFGSSSSDEELLGEDDLEVSDWLDEPMDAVLTPRKSTGALSPSHHGSSNSHRGRSFSSVSSTSTNASRSMSGSALSHSHVSASGSHHRPSLPNLGGATTSNSSLSTWLSGQEDADDEMDFDYEPAVLTDFMRENMPVYEVMKQVQLFRNLSTTQQEQVMRALKPAKFAAGEAIVQQGTRGSRFYMIAKGEAVVTKRIDATDKEDRMITHLHPGHYFGELALIYDDPRTATVRAVTDVALLYLTQEDFQRIGQVHLSLMLQQVPLLAQLNGRDQDAVLSRLKPANFNDGEYIVRQGDQGTRFYMITRGEAVVSEIDTRPEAAEGQERELTRLYEGHVFGEMALIYSEPRTASVRAVGPVKCLYLTKEDFDKCLTSERFHRFIQHAYVEKATRRAMRLKVQQRAEKESASTPASTPHGGSSSGSLVPPPAPTSPVRATETKKLVRRLKNGQKVVNKYVIKGDLGKGTFGRVKLCQSEEDGKLYAVKIMHRTFVQRMAGKEDQLQDVLRREVAIMKKLNHKNVVKLVEVIDDPSSQKMYLVQEYVQHNLMDEVNRARGLNEEVARKYTRDLLVGLNYLHYHKVIHRDIKPENILVSADGVAKIADFGTARMVMNESESISGAKGTPAFMAPEMFDLDATYQGPSVDVWSLGATLYMMIIGVPPWLADNEIILAERVQHDELTFPADYERAMDPHLKNLLQRMLTKNPKLRISLSDCFTHDWITKEGSDPLVSFSAQLSSEQLLTVSIDESERAIQNIPERIDLSLSEFLEQAHNLVKTRQQTGGSNNSMIHRTGSGHSWPTGGSANGEKVGSSSSLVGGAFEGRSTSSSISSPSRPSAEETTRIIRAWRHHKRVQLMYGHKELSERSRELLLEQKRVAFSAERAKVTEIILPTTGPSGSNSAPKMRLQHTASGPLSPRDRHKSSPGILGSSEMPVGFHQKSLSKKSSFKSAAADEYPSLSDHTLVGFGRTSFTSVSGLSELLSVDETLTEKSFRDSASDADLLKRSLSRKKDFLMVTSEVFRDEDGDFQSRKILFQARDQDFSVASRATTHSKSGRHIGRNSSATMKKTGSRRSLTSNISMGSVGSSVGSTHSNQSQSSTKLEMTGVTAASSDIDLDGIDCVQVTYDGEEDDDEMEYVAEHDSGSGGPHSTSSSGEGSDYSDVEGDVDVDETFNDLIGSSTLENEPDDDDEIAPMGASRSSMPAALLLSPSHDPRHIVQVYVSSKIRENLVLGIRSGYAEAKGSRSYMEDKIVGVARCGFDGYDTGTRDRLETSFASLGFFAVYDGHNGDDTAKFLQSELHHRLFKTPEFAEDPLATITDVCATVDLEILDKQNRSVATPKRKRLDDDDEEEKGDGSCACHEGEDHDATRQSKMTREDGGDDSTRELAHKSPMCLQPISFSGSTAVFVVVTSRAKTPSEDDETSFTEVETDQETVLYVANLGDSRAVLCTASGVAVDLTKDHKASDDEERRGIEKRGGFVHNGRLDGVLALSRGFGDLAHKTEGHLGSVPDVTQRVVAKDDEFLLLASDGLFDVLSSQQAINFIYRKLRLHGDVQLAAQEMVLKAQQYFAHDNISVVVVALNQHDDGRSVRRSDSSASNVSDATTPRPAAV